MKRVKAPTWKRALRWAGIASALLAAAWLARMVVIYVANAVPYYTERVVLQSNPSEALRDDFVDHASEARAWDVLGPLATSGERLRVSAQDKGLLAAQDEGPAHSRWGEYVMWHSQRREIVTQLREAATREVLGYHFPSPVVNPPRLLIVLPDGAVRVTVRLLRADAYLAIEEGDIARATDTIVAICRWSRLLSRTESGLSLKTSCAIHEVATNLLGKMIGKVPTDRLRAVEREVGAAIDVSPERLSRIAELESQDLLQRVLSDDGQGGGGVCREGMQFIEDVGGTKWTLLQRIGFPLVRRVFDRKFATLADLKIREEFDSWATEQPWQRADFANVESIAQQLPHAGAMAFVPASMRVALDRELRYYFDRFLSQQSASVLGIRAEIVKRTTGSYPLDLDDLLQAGDSAEPLDRFTGTRLLYRVAKDGVVIASRGPDGDDDGSTKAVHRDVVWREVDGFEKFGDCDEILWGIETGRE